MPHYTRHCTITSAILAHLCGWLLARPSRIGKAGIHLFYQQYRFLTKPATAAASVAMVYFLVAAVLFFIWFRNKKMVLTASVLMLLFAIAGAEYAYYDFTHNFSHQL